MGWVRGQLRERGDRSHVWAEPLGKERFCWPLTARGWGWAGGERNGRLWPSRHLARAPCSPKGDSWALSSLQPCGCVPSVPNSLFSGE